MWLQQNPKISFVKRKKQFIVLTALVVSVILGAAATAGKPKDVVYENLKVLPRNISSRELQGLMTDDFEDGLGVECGFCHAPAKDGHGIDYASDAKPEKEIARAMMRMTLGINKKFFKVKHPVLGSAGLTVTCETCHKGQPFPDGAP
jgi:hypothetical protein